MFERWSLFFLTQINESWVFFLPSHCARLALLRVDFLICYSFCFALAMACLVHEKRFRSTFHAIINVLRREARTPSTVLRTMPSQCCTCHAKESSAVDPIAFDEADQLVQLENLTKRVNDEKQSNPELVSSLNRFRTLIRENRGPAPVPLVHVDEPAPMETRVVSDGESTSSSARSWSRSASSSSSSPDLYELPLSRPARSRRRRSRSLSSRPTHNHTISRSRPQIRKRPRPAPKPIKSGTFVFLPYMYKVLGKNRLTDHLMEVGQSMQLKRFFGNVKELSEMEKMCNARIHVLTSTSSAQVNQALENAKKGFKKLTIRNRDATMAMSEEQMGEWVFVRPRRSTAATNVDRLLDDLTDRWEKCLNLKKRQRHDANDSDDSDSPRKRRE